MMGKTILIAVLAAFVALFGVSCATACRTPIEEHAIVYEELDGGRPAACARELANYLRTQTGVKIVPVSETESVESEAEILIGQLDRPETREAMESFLSPMDYSIRITGDKVVIVGFTSFATAAATEKYIELVTENPKLLKSGSFAYDYHFDTSNFNAMCYDISQFTPLWSAFYTPQSWMVDDLYETLYAVTQKDGRLTAFAHRGDFVYYPQSSLEGIASACMAGADIVEIDFRLTKDNIPIVMHDEDLRKNTNCASKMGRNGLPDSYYVGDWTYEELLQLNMVKNDGTVTKCKICTCYEALLVGAMFGAQLTWDDKADETLYPVFAATLSTTFADMYPLMECTQTLENFFYYYGYYLKNTELDFWDAIEADYKDWTDALPFWKNCLTKTMTENYAIAGVWASWDGDVRYKLWGYDKQMENDRYWSIWYDEGKTQIWTNCIVACTEYIGNTFEPEDYSAMLL